LTKEQQEERVCADRAQILANFLKKALQNYGNKNKMLPQQIAIYRDGVGGPSYVSKVIESERTFVVAAI
jgi:hypothetical protein